MFASLPASWHHVKANRLRALAVSTAQRSDFLPDLPTIAESGVAEFEASTWWGLFAQGKTPKEAIAKLNAEVQSIIAAEDIKARFAAEGARGVIGMTPEAFNALVRSDIAKWRKIAKERNINGS
jgi:tripartite-type tricarboxylate transporter receptor subunit TctC